jgi:N-carbamoyl-L-amino-acid hydrolase
MWAALAEVGRVAATGGYRRFAWTPPELQCRAWFRQEAAARGLDTHADRNGNLWAWDGAGRPGQAVVTGSHLDSVPDGGAYDGPLGIVSAFAALDILRADDWRPARPLAIVAFSDEEGARFGVACAGSRLLTGALDPGRAAGLRDADGTTLAEAMRAAGEDPEALGRDDDLLARVGCYVELHVEQGRALAGDPDGTGAAAVGVATAIWPHGRWRLDFRGAADHAGTTRLEDRRDPMLPFAETVLLARERAAAAGARATIGRVRVAPNGTNAIASEVTAWLDARAPDEATVRAVVDEVVAGARWWATRQGVEVDLAEESWSGETVFDPLIAERLSVLVGRDGRPAPLLPTGAGHDAGVLAAAGVPTAMLFVRNPTGVSHSPAEYAEPDDCRAGVLALSRVLAELAGTPS